MSNTDTKPKPKLSATDRALIEMLAKKLYRTDRAAWKAYKAAQAAEAATKLAAVRDAWAAPL